MTGQETKAWIKTLAEAYFAGAPPDQRQALQEAWEALDTLALLDQGGLRLRPGDAPATVAASPDLGTVLTVLVLGVISNTVYDTLKWSAQRVAQAMRDRAWQERAVERLGELAPQDKAAALTAQRWTLAQVYRTRLRQLLVEHFDEGELRTLCFDLGVAYDDLPGAGRADKARELILYLERRECLPQLVKVGAKLRPQVSWGKVPGGEIPGESGEV